MNQRQKASAALAGIRIPINFDELQTIIGEAQNGPPDGGSDGSLDEKAWTALRDLTEALQRARAALNVFEAAQ